MSTKTSKHRAISTGAPKRLTPLAKYVPKTRIAIAKKPRTQYLDTLELWTPGSREPATVILGLISQTPHDVRTQPSTRTASGSSALAHTAQGPGCACSGREKATLRLKIAQKPYIIWSVGRTTLKYEFLEPMTRLHVGLFVFLGSEVSI